MPTEEIAYQITIRGGEEAARVIEAIERAMNKQTNSVASSSRALTQSVTASKASGDAATAASLKFNTFGSTLGLTGQALGRFNPAMGQAVSAMGQASGVIQTLTTSGVGPFGVAIGVAAAAVGILSPLIAEMGNESERTAQIIERRLTGTLTEMIAKAHEAQETLERYVRLGQGRGDFTEQQQYQSEASSELADVNRRISNLNRDYVNLEASDRDLLRSLERRRSELSESVARREALTQQAASADAFRATNAANLAAIDAAMRDQQGSSGSGRGSRGSASNQLEDLRRRTAELQRQGELNQWLARLDEQIVAGRLHALKVEEEITRQKERNSEAIQREIEAQQELAEKERTRFEQAKMAAEMWRESMGKGAGGDSKGDQEADAARVAELTAMYQQLGNTAASSLEASIAAGGSAGAVMQNFFKDMAGSLAKMEIAKAISETAEGLGALASVYLSGTAPAHFAAAAQHAAAATAFGLLGAAIPAAPTGGGSAAPSVGETRPQRNSSGSRDSENTTVVVNFGGAVVTAATQAELGRQITRAVNAGSSRLGRS